MITWGKGQKQRINMRDGTPTQAFHYWQDSIEPKGYWIVKVPNQGKCHLLARHEADGKVTLIGHIENLDDRDLEAKAKAADTLRGLCEQHAAGLTPG